MFLCYHLNEPDQVLPLRWLQLWHHRSEVAQVTVDAVRLSRVDWGQHPQQHVVTCPRVTEMFSLSLTVHKHNMWNKRRITGFPKGTIQITAWVFSHETSRSTASRGKKWYCTTRLEWVQLVRTRTSAGVAATQCNDFFIDTVYPVFQQRNIRTSYLMASKRAW